MTERSKRIPSLVLPVFGLGRFRLVFVFGVLFGIALMTVIVVSDGLDGVPVLFFMLALLLGGRVSRWVRRALKPGISTESESAEGDEDPEAQPDLMSRLASIGDTTGKQLVNLMWLALGFAVGAGLALLCAVVVDAQLGG